MARVACVGICVRDIIFSVPSLPAGPGKAQATGYSEVGGGPAANAAVTIASLDGSPSFLGAVGDDRLGQQLVNELDELGVDITHVQRVPGHRSPISAITVDTSGERAIVNYTDDRLLEEANPVADRELDGVDAVLVDVRWPKGAVSALEWAKEAGRPGIVDFDLGAADPEPLLATATHIAFSADALRNVTEVERLEDALIAVSERTDSWVGVTDGERGAFWLEGDQIRHMEAFRVTTVDTTGAGDVFHGAFALGIASGRTEADSVRLGSAAAAITCMRFGGRSGIPRRDEVETFLEERT